MMNTKDGTTMQAEIPSLYHKMIIYPLQDVTMRIKVDQTVNAKDLPGVALETKDLGGMREILPRTRDSSLSHLLASDSGQVHPQIRGMTNGHQINDIGRETPTGFQASRKTKSS